MLLDDLVLTIICDHIYIVESNRSDSMTSDSDLAAVTINFTTSTKGTVFHP
jgi:hypothetical protein